MLDEEILWGVKSNDNALTLRWWLMSAQQIPLAWQNLAKPSNTSLNITFSTQQLLFCLTGKPIVEHNCTQIGIYINTSGSAHNISCEQFTVKIKTTKKTNNFPHRWPYSYTQYKASLVARISSPMTVQLHPVQSQSRTHPSVCHLQYYRREGLSHMQWCTWMCWGVVHSFCTAVKRLSESKKRHQDCLMSSTQSFYSPCLQSVVHSLTCCFSRNVPLLHTSRYIIACNQFYQLVLQVTNTGVRRTGYTR